MSVKISELPILDSLADNDVIAGVDTSANVTSKIEMATLKNYIDTNTQYTAGTNIDITNNVISAPFVYDRTQTNALLDDFKDETNALIEDLETSVNEQLEEKDEQIEELQSEVDSLSTIFNAFPTESGEGESLTLDDTAEVKFKKFDLKGNTSQTGTPTPTTPIPVNVVSGDNEISVTGRNLLEGVEYGDIIAQTGEEITSTSVIKSKNYIPYYRNTTYYLSVNSVMPTNIGVNLRFYNKNKEYIGYAGLTGSGSNFNITIVTSVEDTTPMYFRFRETLSVGPITSLNDNVMITTVNNMNYEPFGNTYNINLGMKNLWNSEDMKSGFLPQSGSYPTTNSSYPNARYVLVNLLKGQSITLSGITFDGAGRIRYIDKDTNQVVGNMTYLDSAYYTATHTFGDGFYEGTITAKKDFIVGIVDLDGNVNNLIVNYGTTPQAISDTPIELCKIGDYQDYIYKDSDKWYLHKEIGKVVLDGSENWEMSEGGNLFYKANIISKLIAPTTSGVGTALCNKYVNVGIYSADSNKGFILLSNGTTQTNCRVREESMGTVEAFKTSLQNNNAIIYSIIATPTNEEITYQPLIDQLNLLEKAISYDSQTNISQVNNDLGFIIYAEAIKSLQNVLDRIELLES